jgi:predicted acyl esterase
LAAGLSLAVADAWAAGDPPGSETWIPTSDGKKLKAYVLLPAQGEDGPWPTILIYTSYGARIYRDAVLGRRTGPGRDGENLKDPLFGPDPGKVFAYVFVDRRGRNESVAAWYQGCPSVGQDGAEAVAWIAKQGFCNGKIGAFGRSSDGINPLLTAAERPPALRAVAASVARMTDDYTHYYPGGVLEEGYLALLDGAWQGSWTTITSHPLKDSWWDQRIAEQTISPQSIEVPILFQTGWWDHNVDFSFAGFAQLRDLGPTGKMTRLVVGPWSHSTSGVLKQGDVEYPNAHLGDKKHIRRFFDRWLRGIDDGFDRQAPVSYYQTGGERWISSTTWPPDTADRSLYLRSDGGLSVEPPGDEPPDRYSADPSDPSPSIGGPIAGKAARFPDLILGPAFQDQQVLAGRDDYLMYDTPPLDEDLEVAGHPGFEAYISCDQPDTDITVRLCDYDPSAPEGSRSLLIMTGIRRMRYRESLRSPVFMEPETIYRARIEMDAIAHKWRKGHRVRLIVSSSNYPLYAVNPNNGEDFVWQPAEERIAAVQLYHDTPHPSVLILPVEEKTPATPESQTATIEGEAKR